MSLLTVLEARGIDLPDEARDQIGTCTDWELLDALLRQAAVADQEPGESRGEPGFPSWMKETIQAHDKARARAEGRAEGLIEGQITALLIFLDERRIAVTDAERERITSCVDVDLLREWYRCAVVNGSMDDVFR